METERNENMETAAAQEDDEVLALVEDLQAMGINAAVRCAALHSI